MAVEKSRLEFRIWDMAVRSITSVISRAIDSNRCSTTARVTGSGRSAAPAVATVPVSDSSETSSSMPPYGSILAVSPASTSTVVKSDSRTAGPATETPGDRSPIS